MPSRRRKSACIERAERLDAHRFGRVHQRLEVDMRGEVDRAGRGERIGIAVAADGLKGVAGGAVFVAVVDDQRRAAVARDAARQLEGRRVVAPFEDLAVGRLPHQLRAAVRSKCGIGSSAMP